MASRRTLPVFACALLMIVCVCALFSGAHADEDDSRAAEVGDAADAPAGADGADFLGDLDDDDADESDGDAANAAGASAADEPKPDAPAVIDPEGAPAADYSAPDTSGAVFADNFQDGLGKWTHSTVSMYAGRFAVGQGAKPSIPGDKALIIPQKARHYALTAPVAGLDKPAADDLVVQYEVKLEEGMTCGGAYLKLPTDGFPGAEAFDNNVKYSVMFGPDRCGSNDKVHFIFQSKNPTTGEFVEHHLKNPPPVASSTDKKTHLYTLVVRANGTASVAVDGDVKRWGDLLSDEFDPPLQPPEKIGDPDDEQPKDWVTEKKIADPDATRPDDWDDRKEIPDPEKTEAPEGWLPDEPLKIPDPEAKQPEKWNEEDDGEWEAPLIDNPKCTVGCGEWTQPFIPNPDYKGEWSAPLMDNPKYIGEWEPRKIDNPAFYKVEQPGLLPIRAVGFEIWTMDQGVLFDNLWIGKSVEAAAAYAADTFEIKKAAEEKAEKAELEKREAERAAEEKSSQGTAKAALGKLDSVLSTVEDGLRPVEAWLAKIGAEPLIDKIIDAGVSKPMLVVVSVPLVIVLLMLILLSGSGSSKKSTAAAGVAEKKKRDVSTPDDQPDAPAGDEGDVQAAGTESREVEPALRRRRATAD